MSSPMRRNQHVHGGNGFTVLVLAHVKGLDFLGVVVHCHGLLKCSSAKVALVLGLQVCAKGDRKGKILATVL